MANDLDKKIVKQIEYYFGDHNLPRDKFLLEKIKEDDGWVALETLLTFNRLASLSKDHEVIVKAIENSDKKFIKVSEDRTKLRRTPDLPIPEDTEERRKIIADRTAYAKGFAIDEELDEILKFLETFGGIDSCIRRYYIDLKTKEKHTKPSVFVIFKDVDVCKKFVDADSIKYKDTELERMMSTCYQVKKEKEIAEKRKKGKPDKRDTEPYKPVIPSGCLVHFTITYSDADKKLKPVELSNKIKEKTTRPLAFVDIFEDKENEGYLRFKNENSGKEFCAELKEEKLVLEDVGELVCKLMEGDDEKKMIETVSAALAKFGNKVQNKRKRKGPPMKQRGGKRKH